MTTAALVTIIALLAVAVVLMGRRLTAVRRQIEDAALHDPLTGLPNRRLFDTFARKAITQAKREQWRLLLMVIDLDGFREVNDSVSHAAGDEVLCETARRLRSVLREEEHLARQGGDEFVALLLNMKDLRAVPAISRRLIEASQTPIQVHGKRVRVSISIGISRYPEDGQTVDELVRRAAQAMHNGKQAGKGTYRLSHGPSEPPAQKAQAG